MQLREMPTEKELQVEKGVVLTDEAGVKKFVGGVLEFIKQKVGEKAQDPV